MKTLVGMCSIILVSAMVGRKNVATIIKFAPWIAAGSVSELDLHEKPVMEVFPSAECRTFYDNEKCSFPFTYDGEVFNECTDKGTANGLFFCKTQSGGFGACNRNCEKATKGDLGSFPQ